MLGIMMLENMRTTAGITTTDNRSVQVKEWKVRKRVFQACIFATRSTSSIRISERDVLFIDRYQQSNDRCFDLLYISFCFLGAKQ